MCLDISSIFLACRTVSHASFNIFYLSWEHTEKCQELIPLYYTYEVLTAVRAVGCAYSYKVPPEIRSTVCMTSDMENEIYQLLCFSSLKQKFCKIHIFTFWPRNSSAQKPLWILLPFYRARFTGLYAKLICSWLALTDKYESAVSIFSSP